MDHDICGEASSHTHIPPSDAWVPALTQHVSPSPPAVPARNGEGGRSLLELSPPRPSSSGVRPSYCGPTSSRGSVD